LLKKVNDELLEKKIYFRPISDQAYISILVVTPGVVQAFQLFLTCD